MAVRIEHVAFNVADPIAAADWYCKNLEMKVARSGPPPANGRFLADSTGNVILEIYHFDDPAVPDYASMSPLLFHTAFHVDDVAATVERLKKAGCSVVDAPKTVDSGDTLAMLRDPFGIALQVLRRAKPMLKS